MIELNTFIGVLFILIGSMFGFQILIYSEYRTLNQKLDGKELPSGQRRL